MKNLPAFSLRSFAAIPAAFCLFLFCPLNLEADTIELTSGEVIEGTILRETPDGVVIKTRFSETIMEERLVKRAEIKKLTKVQADEQAFAALEKIAAPATAFGPEAYSEALKPLRDFTVKYSYSSRMPAVREKIRSLEGEQKKIAAGAVKIDGKVLTEEEMEARKDEIASFRKLAGMERKAAGGDLAGALNEFFVFAKENPGSPVLVDAIEQARAHLRSLIGVLEHQMRGNSVNEKRREEQLALANPAGRASLEAARNAEIERLKAATERAKEAGAVILPYAPFSLESLQAAHGTATQELKKLDELSIDGMKRSVQLLGEARKFFDEREFQASLQRLEQSLTAWPDNEAAAALKTTVEAEIESRKQSDERQAGAVAEGFTSSSTEKPAATEPKQPE